MRSCYLASAVLAASIAACDHDTASQGPPAERLVGIADDVPTDAFRRVLWRLRSDLFRGVDSAGIVLVQDTARIEVSDSTTSVSLPARLRTLIEAEQGFSLAEGFSGFCANEIRVLIAGAQAISPNIYRIAVDEYDYRWPAGRTTWGQEYIVRCNESVCEVTQIVLGEEPDLELDRADETVCRARQRDARRMQP